MTSKLKELGQLTGEDKEFILSMLDKLISAFIKRGEKEKEKPKEAAVVETKEGTPRVPKKTPFLKKHF